MVNVLRFRDTLNITDLIEDLDTEPIDEQNKKKEEVSQR